MTNWDYINSYQANPQNDERVCTCGCKPLTRMVTSGYLFYLKCQGYVQSVTYKPVFYFNGENQQPPRRNDYDTSNCLTGSVAGRATWGRDSGRLLCLQDKSLRLVRCCVVTAADGSDSPESHLRVACTGLHQLTEMLRMRRTCSFPEPAVVMASAHLSGPLQLASSTYCYLT